MVGSLGIISASAAKSFVSEFLRSMAASADVLALAKVAFLSGTEHLTRSWRLVRQKRLRMDRL